MMANNYLAVDIKQFYLKSFRNIILVIEVFFFKENYVNMSYMEIKHIFKPIRNLYY